MAEDMPAIRLVGVFELLLLDVIAYRGFPVLFTPKKAKKRLYAAFFAFLFARWA